jgi:hypothetical protein
MINVELKCNDTTTTYCLVVKFEWAQVLMIVILSINFKANLRIQKSSE